VNEPLLSRNAKITLLILLAAGSVLYLLADVVAPLAMALLAAYFFDPLIDRFEAHKISRTVAILVVALVMLLVLTGFLLIFIPMLETEIERFISRLPGMLNSATQRLDALLAPLVGSDGPGLVDRLTDSLKDYASTLSADQLKPLSDIIGSTFSGASSLLGLLVTVGLVPIFTFYFLRDFDRIKLYPLQVVPLRHRDAVVSIARDIDAMMANFIRGQGTVCLILAVLYTIGYTVSGVPLGVLIGLIAGGLAFIPYVGSGLGLVLSLLMVLLDWQSAGPLVGAIVTFGVVQTLESYVITPRIVGDKVGLSPVMVIVALLAFGELFGFAGVLVAVPASAALKILWGRAKAQYQKSHFFTDGTEA
jgi:predicted PurR-regulated permease PerM